MRIKITERWLAEKEGIFFLITRALLVIKRAWLLAADWLSTTALSWFPASNGFWKNFGKELRNPSLLSLIYTPLFQLNVKENQHATKRSLLLEKQRIFPTKNALIRSLKKVWVGTACVARSIELQNFMATKLKANFFVSLRVALLVLQVTLSA